ncbi:MAG: crossover junction endodeoxyribonuclease RuvC [Candidatus Helarchaeota archaeon]
MKIKIKELEKKLGYKIKKNFLCTGFDTAKRTGVCSIKTKKNYAYFDWFFVEFDNQSHKETLKQMYKEFKSILLDEDMAVVEEVFLGYNRAGSLQLAKMGTMVVANCVNKEIDFELVLAITARAKLKIDSRKFGKGNSKKSVAYWLKNTLDIEVEDEDISDAIVLGLLGICEGMDFSVPKKSKKRRRKRK